MDEKDAFQLQDFLPYLLNQAAEAASLSFQKVYKGRYGMLRTEWRVLFHLGLYGRLTATEIGERSGLHKTKISRAVAALEGKRFIVRERDDEDRRVEYLTLTTSGLAAYKDLRAIAQSHEERLLKAFTPEEAALLKRGLKRLAGA
ncbi:MAG: MarR family transcriptional regulator [Rhodobacteraceae bacterium]|jgi:DNA-binding MarR family transcriptional regulator|nr:MarR family transcriptional regulator [Paracoccaceae bacterium]